MIEFSYTWERMNSTLQAFQWKTFFKNFIAILFTSVGVVLVGLLTGQLLYLILGLIFIAIGLATLFNG